MRGFSRFLVTLLAAAVALPIAIASSAEPALSQDSDSRPYAPGAVIVKPVDGASSKELGRVANLNGTGEEAKLGVASLRLAETPEGLTVAEAVDRYEALPGVEYAEPDYYIEPVQESGDEITPDTGSYEPLPGDVVEAAPSEPPPPNPPPDELFGMSGTQTSGITPYHPSDALYAKHLLWGLNNEGHAVNGGAAGVPDSDIDAPEAWSAATGSKGTVVAVIDTGVDVSHPDLDGNIWTNPDEVPDNGVDDDVNGYVDDVNGWDFHNRDPNDPTDKGDNTVYDASDIDAHGTHVAGTLAAEGNNGIGVTGVSWRAHIMPLKVMSETGGRTSSLITAVEYAASEGAVVANASLACASCPSNPALNQALRDAIAAAGQQHGQLFVAAAGNSGQDSDSVPTYPASYDLPNIVSVAATDNRDALWVSDVGNGSNYGATAVDLAAPGDNILSTVPNGGYAYNQGTSMAAPHVSGVAALLAGTSPNLSYQGIKDAILAGAEKKSALNGKTVTGGRLNAGKSLGLAYAEATLVPDKGVLAYGQGVSFTGKLTRFGEPLGGKTVMIDKRGEGETDFGAIAQVTTAADGTFAWGPSYPTKHSHYRARFGGDTGSGPSVNNAAERVDVKATVSLSVAQTDLKLGRARAIAGYVRPLHPGSTVRLTIDKLNSPWVIYRTLTLDANSRYAYTFKPSSQGRYTVRAEFAGDADHLGNTSVLKDFRVVN